MRVYTVGGWVRDTLLAQEGLATTPSDRDWVVVGSSPVAMLAAGFAPVGRNFPVFLHPTSHEEYALARTERKSAPGYTGFTVHAAPDVTLEADLGRRDLTVNAMALDIHGNLVDPYGGLTDLRARVLRHVGPAFAEDPVRILRVARFAARYAEFTVAPETMQLMQGMVANGEADALAPERVIKEVTRGLVEATPSRMVEVLQETGLLARLYPEMHGIPVAVQALTRCTAVTAEGRFALLLASCADANAVNCVAERMCATKDQSQLADLLARLRQPLSHAATPEERLSVLEQGDAFRRPERFEAVLSAWSALHGRDATGWLGALHAAQAVNPGAIAAQLRGQPWDIGAAVHTARLSALTPLQRAEV